MQQRRRRKWLQYVRRYHILGICWRVYNNNCICVNNDYIVTICYFFLIPKYTFFTNNKNELNKPIDVNSIMDLLLHPIPKLNTVQCCSVCGKSYSKMTNYKKHVSACELLSQVKKAKSASLEEGVPVPSVQTIYSMLLIMVEKQATLEHKVTELTKQVGTKRKKICDALDELPEKPTMTFHEWLDSVHPTDTDLDQLPSMSLPDAMVRMCVNTLFQNPPTNQPICISKTRKLFVFDADDHWRELSDERFQSMAYKLNARMQHAETARNKKKATSSSSSSSSSSSNPNKKDAHDMIMKKLLSITDASIRRTRTALISQLTCPIT